MTTIKDEIISVFGNKLRVRVSGICIDSDKILLVKHKSLGPNGIFWAPPGGGMHFGESAENSLKREFLEETGVEVEVKKFLFVHEFLDPPLHAIELFFEVKIIQGNIIRGKDPEMLPEQQIIDDIKFFSFNDFRDQDLNNFHHIFSLVAEVKDILNLKGYYKHEISGNKTKKS